MKLFIATLLLSLLWPLAVFAQFSDNFESDSLSGWLQFPAGRWSVTTIAPLSGYASLKHTYDNNATATDIIYRGLTGCSPAQAILTWRFMLRHAYNPSGSNKWGVMLMANTPASEWHSGGTFQGYVIGVNQGSNTDDTLGLYAVKNNTYTLIRKTTVNWEKDIKTDGIGAVEVIRTNDGQWTIRVASGNNFDHVAPVAAPVLHSTYTDAQYSGLIYTYTAAADQLLWLDEVSLNIIPVEPPQEPVYGDVVFSEIMAKADPSVGLPEVQYLELYNRSGREIKLEGWKIYYNNTTIGNIGTVVMPENSYLILCASSMVPTMKIYGNAVSLTNIASLTKSGKTLLLKNNKAAIISRVCYSDKWIENETKRSGGWSLEKIDLDNLSESSLNWIESQSPEGGTPGVKNSVQAVNPDTEAPYIVDIHLIDRHRLGVEINEWLHISAALQVSAYEVSNGIGCPAEVLYDEADPLHLVLSFRQEFEQGLIYELLLQAPLCDLAGNVPAPRPYQFADLLLPQQGEIVINEVLFHPFAGGADFVEIINCSDKTFDARNLKLANRNKSGEVASMETPTDRHYFYPGDYLVFTTNIDMLWPFYTIPFPERIVTLPTFPSYPNTEGCVVLLNTANTVLDEFYYTEKMHSAFISKPEGVSLERINPKAPAADKSSWQSAAQLSGWATPTYRNSQFTDEHQPAAAEFSLSSKIFSPDNDGVQDILYIDYNLPEPGYSATVTIYDMQGRQVRLLAQNSLLGASGRLSWDAARDNGQKAAVGMYIIYINAYNTAGMVKTYKLSCAVIKH